MKLTFFSDPGHGWLRVKRAVLFRMSIAHRITQYSYQKGDSVYLEEDCDATLFIRTAQELGIELKISGNSRGGFIRKLDSYRMTQAEMLCLNPFQQIMAISEKAKSLRHLFTIVAFTVDSKYILFESSARIVAEKLGLQTESMEIAGYETPLRSLVLTDLDPVITMARENNFGVATTTLPEGALQCQ